MRSPWFAAASAAALIAASAMSACSTSATSDTGSSNTATAQTMPEPDTDGDYTDAQLTAFIAARNEIDPISRGFAELSEEERAQATQQISGILQTNQMNPATYDAIQRQLQTDQALAARVTDIQLANLTDDQLRGFVAASLEIAPITADLATASEAEREQASARIGAILQTHNIDSNLYNAIAARAQSDEALAARISALQIEMAPSAEPEGGGE